MTKKVLKSKIMIIIVLIFALLLPQTINIPKQIDKRAFVIGVGVDKGSDDNYILSAQVVVPQTTNSFEENLQVYSAEGINVLECVENLSLHIGKITGFGNVSSIVFGNEIASEGIYDALDFFMRSKRLNNNAIIVTTNKKAKDLLYSIAKIDKNFGYSLNGISKMNSESLITSSSHLESFLNDYYNNVASLVSQIRQESDEDMGIDSLGSQQNSGSTTTASTNGDAVSSDSVVSNSGFASLFLKGKEIAVISPEQTKGFNNLKGIRRGVFTIKNVSDKFYRNAEVVMSIKREIVKKTLTFKNGIPQVKYRLNYNLKVEEILQNGVDKIILNGNENYLTKAVEDGFRSLVKNQIASSINYAKSYNADILGNTLDFFRYKPSEWRQFVKKLPDKNDALSKIEYFVDIDVKGNI